MIDAASGRIQRIAEGKPPLMFAYGARRLFGNEHRSGPAAWIETLFNDGCQLGNPEEWLAELARKDDLKLREVVSALLHIIQIDGRFRTISLAEDDRTCLLNMLRERPAADGTIELRPVPQPLKVVSSGYRAVLALVCDILRGLFDAHPNAALHAARHRRPRI